MTETPEERRPLPCARCGAALRYLTAIPKRFDQATGFVVFHCESCAHVQWQARSQE